MKIKSYNTWIIIKKYGDNFKIGDIGRLINEGDGKK